jgi:hypothetical protein
MRTTSVRLTRALALAVTVCCVVPALASASEPRWHENGKLIESKKEVKLAGELELRDYIGEVGTEVRFECPSTIGTGAVNVAGLAEMTTFSAGKCSTQAGSTSCETESIEALKMPWSGLALNGIGIELALSASGRMQLKWKCRVLGTNLHDECEVPEYGKLSDQEYGVLDTREVIRGTCKEGGSKRYELLDYTRWELGAGKKLEIY